MDKYLRKELDLYEYYTKAARERISFENLWMLFDPDELIYCHSQKPAMEIPSSDNADDGLLPSHFNTPQAYRVLSSFGGMLATSAGSIRARATFDSLLVHKDGRPRNAAGAALPIRERYTPFYLDCYFIHFDGANFKPWPSFFMIKPYEGEVMITSLEVYPMRYRPSQGPMSSEALDLVERGRKFLELTTVEHKTYKGATLGDDKEEVSEASRPALPSLILTTCGSLIVQSSLTTSWGSNTIKTGSRHWQENFWLAGR